MKRIPLLIALLLQNCNKDLIIFSQLACRDFFVDIKIKRLLMSIISSDSGKISRYIFDYSKPQTYLNLMQKVGDSGKYQKKVLIVFILCWFVAGVILLGNSFLFRNRLYDCSRKGILLEDLECLQYVCQLQPEQWNDFLDPSTNNFNNIATINNYECQDSFRVIILRAATYSGAILGFLIISFFSDNYGRKFSLVLAWGICVIGSLLVTFGYDTTLIGIGLFLSGFGSDAAINITYLYFCQISNNKVRQKYSVIIQIFFTIGAFVATTSFFVIPSWRIIWGLVVTFPSIIIFLLLYYYIEQTPHFLLKKGLNAALKSLNRIGKINLQRRQTLEQQDIQNVIDFRMIQKFKDVKLTHLDLFRFQSLRQKTFLCGIIALMIFGMYYGPVLIIENIGFNIYITSYIILGSQLLIFIPTYALIEKIQRKRMGIIIISISIISSFILALFQSPTQCGICLQSALQIIMIIVFRASVAFFFAFFEIYICQLFPSRVRGLSFGVITSLGSLSSTFIPILLNYFVDQQINTMMIFVLTGAIVIGCLTLLPQTLGRPIKQQIDEVEMYINENNEVATKLVNQKNWRSQRQRNPRSRQSLRMIRSQKN